MTLKPRTPEELEAIYAEAAHMTVEEYRTWIKEPYNKWLTAMHKNIGKRKHGIRPSEKDDDDIAF